MPIPGYSLHDKRTLKTAAQNRAVMAQSKKAKLRFEFAFIDTLARCQYSCKGCFNQELNKTGASLTLPELTSIVDFLQKRGGRAISIAGSGEPLLDPLLLPLVEHAHEKGLRTVLFSTLTQTESGKLIPIKDGIVERLERAKVWIIAKRNSLDNQKQSEFLGVPGSDAGKQMMKGLEKVRKAGFDGRLLMDSSIDRYTLPEIPSLLRFCRKRDILPYFESYITHGQDKDIRKDYKISPADLRKLFLALQAIDAEFGINTMLKHNMRIYAADACKKPEYGFAVKADGEVMTCPTNRKSAIGNIREIALENILSPENERYRTLFGKYGCCVKFCE